MTIDKKSLKEVNLSLSRPENSKLPKCPAKSNKRIKELKEKGEDWHNDGYHFCSDCGCQNAAGLGTTHVGSGWCKHHERGKKPEVVKAFAQRHKKALQSHSPFIYREPDKWLKDVQEAGTRSEKVVELWNEIEVARGLVAEIIEKAKSEEFTESCSVNGVRPASDVSRAKAVKGLLDSIGKLSAVKRQLDQADTFTKDELRVMMSQIGTIAQECILDASEDRQAVWAKFVQKLKNVKEPGE